MGTALHGLSRVVGVAVRGRAGLGPDRRWVAFAPPARKGGRMIPPVLIALVSLAATASPDPTTAAPPAPLHESTVRVPIAGQARLYSPEGKPSEAVLFLSGDGGWNKGVVDMA